jgi:hypothetical protein
MNEVALAVVPGSGTERVTPCPLCPDSDGALLLPRVLASGVDTVHLAMRGVLRPEVWERLEEARREAQATDEVVPVELGGSGQAFNVKGHGLRGYALWLSSPDYEVLLGKSEKFPAALVQLHSAYLHSMGARAAVELACSAIAHDLFAGGVEVTVSRLDLYADVQGWPLEVADLLRFVSNGRSRRGYPQSEPDGDQVHTFGRRTTGFVFGRKDLMCRIYDKTTEIRRRDRVSWLPDLWGAYSSDEPVWRVEFQVRRPVLVEFGLRTVREALDGLQDLWRYCTVDWLTYRQPSRDRRVRRWPIDPVWHVVQAVRISPELLGVVRRRIAQATEERLVQGLQGYLSALAALKGWGDLTEALEETEDLVEAYLMACGRAWADEVQRKAERSMSVTGWLDSEAA